MMDNRAPIEAVLKKRDRSTGYRWTKEILGLLDNAGVFQAAVTKGAPAPHAKGTRDVEAALEAIEWDPGSWRGAWRRCVSEVCDGDEKRGHDTGCPIALARVEIATLRAALAEKEAELAASQGRMAECIAGLLVTLPHEKAALAEKADPARVTAFDEGHKAGISRALEIAEEELHLQQSDNWLDTDGPIVATKIVDAIRAIIADPARVTDERDERATEIIRKWVAWMDGDEDRECIASVAHDARALLAERQPEGGAG